MKPRPTRLTSPKGTLLDRGEATREAILKALPGGKREIAERAKCSLELVHKTMRVLERLGVAERAGTVTVMGGQMVIWRQVPDTRVISPPARKVSKVFQDPQKLPNPVTDDMRAKARAQSIWALPTWVPPKWEPPRSSQRNQTEERP